MKPQPLSKEYFEEEALKKITEGDIFAHKNPVITIKTKGRPYGKLSQHVVKVGVTLPHLTLGRAVFQEPYIFVALWDDESSCSPQHLYACCMSIMGAASTNHLERFAMPLFGGKEAMNLLGVVEKALFDAGDSLDNMGFPIPEYVYIRK